MKSINQRNKKQTIQKISKAKSWLFEKAKKLIHPPLERKRTQPINVRDENRVITKDPQVLEGKRNC